MLKERTIRALREYPTEKVYVYLHSDACCKEFYQRAEEEGFRFGTIKPTENHVSDWIAILEERELAYVGFIGHMACQNRKAAAGGLTVVDYEKYASGENDFLL